MLRFNGIELQCEKSAYIKDFNGSEYKVWDQIALLES